MFSPFENQAASGCPASRGGGPAPNCAQATPAMVTTAPPILSQVNCSPSVSHAITPATGGIRYMKGAERATPRTLLTQVHSIQPKNEHTTSAQKIAAHTAGPSCAAFRSPTNGDVMASITGIENS